MKAERWFGPLLRGALTATLLGFFGAAVQSCSTLAEDCNEAQCWQGASASNGPGSGGGGGGAPCMPEAAPSEGGCVEAGIFVRNEGDNANPGTPSEPVRTLGRAIELAVEGSKVVYACAQRFEEEVELPDGVALYGGLDCDDDWKWTGALTEITVSVSGLNTPVSGAVPLRTTFVGSTTPAAVVEDVHVIAPDASIAGHSSIAVIVAGQKAIFRRCVFESGEAADGVDGDDAVQTPAAGGANGNAGGNYNCSGAAVSGGPQATSSSCGSVGGKGGIGGQSSGGLGSDGQPVASATGQGAPGQPASGGWLCPNASMAGAAGMPGMAGAGAATLGTISALGFEAASGNHGEAGDVGQGGGGGGGAKGSSTPCDPSITIPVGGGGGSGGTGGCGGAGGLGGSGGGSSIALLSLDAFVTLVDVTLRSGKGGSGGDGGAGQPGGNGGNGGPGGLGGGCAGGAGGDGGPGGAGGGGRGGHSIGIAYSGAEPEQERVDFEMGSAGNGGSSPGGPAGQGAAGVAALAQEF